jgi:signal transduction histidine kinase
MVNTLLEVHRLEAGKKTLQFENCDIYEIATEVVEELNPLADEKEILLKIDTSELNQQNENDCIVLGDRLELRRLINNLVGNALKFTDTGSITVRICATPPSSTDKGWIKIEVEDTGYGIAADDLPTLFERFRQGKNKRAGSGLGLHLSRRIVELHGGTIEVTSELGKGSVFTVHLPKK